MKKSVSLLLALTLLLSAAPFASAGTRAQTPRIVDTVYPTHDVVLADIVATEAPYNADATGAGDVSGTLQQALNDCAANGGGTVFLPVGNYRLCAPIKIPQFVTLRGDWQDPDRGTDYGTLLIADVPESGAMTPGLITVGASAGAVGLTVWYPEQTLDDVKPYPYTFYVVGNGDYMLQTIQNVTLLNSYRGVGASGECENGVIQCHEILTVENLKGTCLYEGLNSYNSADVDTHKTVYLLNKYWAEAGEAFHAPDRAALDAYTRLNGVGFVLGDLEWPEFANVKIADRRVGIEFRPGPRAKFSGTFSDLYITNCDYGLYIREGAVDLRGKSWGVAVLRGEIEGEKCAVYDPEGAVCLLTDVAVNGKTEGKNIRRYCADTSSFVPEYAHTYNKPQPNLYVVSADATGRTDASADVQAALDAAAAAGGVVYLPGGLYRFNGPVTVPAGVELRGSSSVPTRCQGGNSSGTLILSYYGYDPALSPLITLEAGAGLNGVRVDFPLNNPTDDSGSYRQTVPAVYAQGADVYVTNCFITLASRGVVLKNAENAFVKKVVGCCYEAMFDLTGCENAFIEGCLQNANALPRNGYAAFDIPELAGRITENNLFTYVFIPITRVRTEFIRLTDCTGVTVFNTFIYGGKTYLKAVNSVAVLTNVGSDGSSKEAPTLDLTGGSLTVLNSMRSTSDGQLTYRFCETRARAALRSYNSMGVDLLYKEGPVLKNIRPSGVGGETLYVLLQPFFTLQALFGRITMDLRQK